MLATYHSILLRLVDKVSIRCPIVEDKAINLTSLLTYACNLSFAAILRPSQLGCHFEALLYGTSAGKQSNCHPCLLP